MLKVLESTNLSKIHLRAKKITPCLLAGVVVVLFGMPDHSIASEKRIYFSGSSSASNKHKGSRKYTGHAKPVVKYHRQHKSVRHHYSNRGHYKTPTGPLVIDVNKVLKRKRLKITNYNNDISKGLNRQVIDNGFGGVRVIYYDTSKCAGGYDCVIRLGDKRSSPKVIVIGEKRMEQPSGPVIIYPPS